MIETLFLDLAERLEWLLAFEGTKGRVELSSALRSLIGTDAPSMQDILARICQLSVSAHDPSVLFATLMGGQEPFVEINLMRPTGPETWRLTMMQSAAGEKLLVMSASPVSAQAPTDQHETASWFHEVSNAMGANLGWVQLARRKPELLEKALHHIESSSRSTQSTSKAMTQRLRRKDTLMIHRASVGSSDVTVLDVSTFLAELVERLRPEIEQCRAQIETHIADHLYVRAQDDQLFSIVWNLAKNALEAFDGQNGKLILRASASGEQVIIEVQDNGPGIPKPIQDRILEPYFTTKSHGTGLGLPWVRTVTQRLGGELSIRSDVGQGTLCRVTLPSATHDAIDQHDTTDNDADAPTRPDFDHSSGIREVNSLEHMRILVVDDEPTVQELIATALELRGARVESYTHAKEALMSQTQHFDLAVIDLTLDTMRGDSLLAKLREQGQVDRCIMCSGASPPRRLDAKGQPNMWLRKPFDLDQLISCIRSVLANRPTHNKASRFA